MAGYKLLTVENPKLAKSERAGWLTAALHLAPSDLSGRDVCPMASAGCRAACLNRAGRGGIGAGTPDAIRDAKRGARNAIQRARIRRTRKLYAEREAFERDLLRDVAALVRAAKRARLKPALRLNATSDLPLWSLLPRAYAAARDAGVALYDYSKIPAYVRRAPHPVTFSRSESNERDALALLADGYNVAVVFAHVPAQWRGFPVINGDASDLRFLDPRGVVVGLKAKGPAKRDASGFVVRD